MSKPTPLAEASLNAALVTLDGWSVRGGKLHREYVFTDFVTAFGFMTSAALVAQALDHHPEWFNVYSRVTVELTTHDAGGISERDLELARAMEDIARRQPQK
ncbi:MAG: pterin-4-alpha-carbinolamine dehydratase [Polyangiaceae bacterium]|jgi:4a-hydroxytetrahydrobiopterin dehydratase|nr:pterin-4-alpha-carbinolamine dehydratase [Polyangiaceae bacterium]